MGAERQDTDPSAKKGGTEPGLGGTPPAGSGRTPAAASSAAADDGPAAVDFDALHAALGDPLDFDELPPAATETPERVGESSGRTNAAYASARPHTIPPSYSPSEDLNAPPVIVASEDTVPSAPPQMTVPVAHAHLPLGPTPLSGVPFLAGPASGGAPGSGPHPAGHPSPGPQALASASYPHTPQPFPVQRGAAQMTVRMPERPLNPRRGNNPTLIVRPRGPSAKQRLLAFMAMLMLVTAGGIAVVIWRKSWLGLDAGAPVTPPSSGPAGSLAPSEASGASPPPPSVASVQAAASATATASATASVRVIRPRPPPPTPPAHPSAGR